MAANLAADETFGDGETILCKPQFVAQGQEPPLTEIPPAVVDGKSHEDAIAAHAEQVADSAPAHVMDVGCVQFEPLVLQC